MLLRLLGYAVTFLWRTCYLLKYVYVCFVYVKCICPTQTIILLSSICLVINNLQKNSLFYTTRQLLVSQSLLITEASQSHSVTHFTLGKIRSDKWSARRWDLYLTRHNIQKERYPCHRRDFLFIYYYYYYFFFCKNSSLLILFLIYWVRHCTQQRKQALSTWVYVRCPQVYVRCPKVYVRCPQVYVRCPQVVESGI